MWLDGIVARPSADLLPRIPSVRDAANPGTEVESYNSAYWRDLAIPWGGYFGTVRALATFAATFLPAHVAINSLSPQTVADMTADQAGGIPGGVESGRVAWPVASWGLGWEVNGAKTRHWTGTVTSPETFCHFGQAGTLLWADPSRDLVLAVFTNRTVTRAWTFFLSRWTTLSDAVASIVQPEALRPYREDDRTDAPNRLGFAVKVIGRPGLKETDSRRWQNGPHLHVSLDYLDAIVDFPGERQLSMYRISSGIRTARLPGLPEKVQVGRPVKCEQCGNFTLVPAIGLAADFPCGKCGKPLSRVNSPALNHPGATDLPAPLVPLPVQGAPRRFVAAALPWPLAPARRVATAGSVLIGRRLSIPPPTRLSHSVDPGQAPQRLGSFPWRVASLLAPTVRSFDTQRI